MVKPLIFMFVCSGDMAPEYAMHGHFSVKSDVFSLGVLILEIVSGQKNTQFQNGDTVDDLLSFVSRAFQGNILYLLSYSKHSGGVSLHL